MPPTATTSPTRAAREDAAREPAAGEKKNILVRLMSLRRHTQGDASYYRAALQAVAEHFRALYAAIDVRIGANSVDDAVTAAGFADEKLIDFTHATLLESASECRSQVRLTTSRSENVAVITATFPDADSGQVAGTIGLACRAANQLEADAKLRELLPLVALVAANKPNSPTGGSDKRLIAMQRALEKAAKCGSLTELAFSLVNGLCEKLHCIQTLMAVEHRGGLRLIAISGLDRIPRQSPGVVVARQAMEECLDAAEPILVQHRGEDSALDVRTRLLHRQWQQAVQGDAVFSLPLVVDGQVVAVVALRRSSKQPFTEEEVSRIPQMLEPFAPAVALFRATDKSLAEHLAARFSDANKALFGESLSARTIAAAIAIAIGGFIAFGSLDYRVATSCVVAPKTTHHLVAPYAGIVGEVLVSAGDHVQAGQTVATLDTRELTLEQDRLAAELTSARINVDRALAAKDGGTAVAAKAHQDAIAVQLNITRQRLARAAIVAPVDGTVIGSELRERIGQVVNLGDTLLQIASDNGRYVELRVPDSSVIHLRDGQTGSFTSAARPHDAIPCQIRRVRPAAEVIDGQNVFVAEAEIERPQDWLRVGMDGYAKISTGKQPVWWILFHSSIDFVRRELWL